MVEREKPYSKEELARIEKVLKKAQEAKKDPKFRAFIKEFIAYHTGSK